MNGFRNGIRSFVVLFAALVLTLSSAGLARAANVSVSLTSGNTFAPATVTVATGDSVVFTWQGGFHNVVFDDGPSSGAPVDQPGLTWTRTFNAAGTYPFHCEVHAPGMAGSVTVTATTPTPTPTPSPTVSPTPSPTVSPTPSPTVSPTPSPTVSPTPSSTPSPTASPAPTASPTADPSPAATVSGTTITSYPFTGPESGLLPGLGSLLLATGGGLYLLRRRRR